MLFSSLPDVHRLALRRCWCVALSRPALSRQFTPTPTPHGRLAGPTVYAILQVLTAAEPFGDTALPANLLRIVMLGRCSPKWIGLAPRLRVSVLCAGMWRAAQGSSAACCLLR